MTESMAELEVMKLAFESSKNFDELLYGSIPPTVLVRLRELNPQSVLDVGCRYGYGLLALYYGLGPIWLEGIDVEERAAMIQSGLDECASQNVSLGSPDLFGILDTLVPDDDARAPRITPENWQRAIRLSCGSETIGLKYRNKYDLFIFSNVLHYMDEVRIKDWIAFIDHSYFSPSSTSIYVRIKTDVPNMQLHRESLMELGRSMAKRYNLDEYRGPDTNEGQAWIWTNL